MAERLGNTKKHSKETLIWSSANKPHTLKTIKEYCLFILLHLTNFMILVQHIVCKIQSLTTNGHQRPFLQKVKQIITHPLCVKIFKRMAPKMILALFPITLIIKKVYQTSINNTSSPVSISKTALLPTYQNIYAEEKNTSLYHSLLS